MNAAGRIGGTGADVVGTDVDVVDRDMYADGDVRSDC